MKFSKFIHNPIAETTNPFSDRTFRELLADWKWILSYTARHKWKVIIYTAVGLLASTLSVASAYITALLINIVSTKQLSQLSLYIGLTVGIIVFSLISNAVKSRLAAEIELDLVKDIQSDLFGNIIELRFSELKQYKNGDMLNRFNKDMETVMTNAISWIPNVIINLYTFTVTVVLLFRMDPIMAWIGLGSTPLLFLLSRYILKRQKHYREKVLRLESDMMSFEAESFYNMDTIKSFGVWDTMTEQLKELQKKYRTFNLDYTMFQIKTNVGVSLLGMVVTFGALAYCLFRLWNGDILFGDMTFFLTQRSSLTTLFNSLMATVPLLLNSAVSAHRIREFTDLPKEEHNPEAYRYMKSVAHQGISVEIKNLSFSYEDGERLYDNLNFSVQSGEIVAVLGESGGGKTTLFRLLLGLIFPETGSVVLRDYNGTEIDMNADMRKFISYVPQGNTLMMGTIAENMRMVKKDATDEEIITALKTACAWEFVEKSGINAQLGERGKGLSEGQAQRISIARAVLRDAPILLLDEATSALDEITESKVLENVIQASPDKTIIISTHRPSVLKKCHRIYKITENNISVSDSTHAADTTA